MPNVYDTGVQVEILALAERSTNTNGSAVDVQQYIKECTLLLVSTAGSGGGNATVKIQDSDNGSTGWADVSGYAWTAVAAAAVMARFKGDLRAVKRYIRAVVTISGTWSGTLGVLLFAERQIGA
jgi:hypothetical protein